MIGSGPLAASPRVVAIGCASIAVALGLAYLVAAGAPARYLAVNAGALIVGLVFAGLAARLARAILRLSGLAVLGMGLALLSTAFYGHTLEGITRWIQVGPLSVQPSLILLPLMATLFARRRDAAAISGIIVAAIALALQPDRAMAGALAAGMAALALTRPDRWTLSALAAAMVGFGVTLARMDTLAPQPFVEHILSTAFGVHVLAGLFVWVGVALLVIPAIAGWIREHENRGAYATFGAVWLGIVTASALGAYPTPLVGYGASSILGYLLSFSMLPPSRAASISE